MNVHESRTQELSAQKLEIPSELVHAVEPSPNGVCAKERSNVGQDSKLRTAAGVTANVDAVDCARFYLYHPLKDPDAMRAAHARASAPASPAPAPATPPASNAGATRIAYVHVPKCGSSFQSMLLLAGCPGITPPELAAAIGVKIKIGPTAICL